VLNDLKYSARSLLRTPASTLALLISLALGVGSNAAIHGFANGIMIGESAFITADGIVMLFMRDEEHAAAPFAFDEYLSLRERHDLFEWTGGAREARSILVRNQQSTVVATASVTPKLAGLLELPLRDGVVISDRLWRSDFHAERVVGETIGLDGVDHLVDGIAPRAVDGLFAGSDIDVWMQVADQSTGPDDRTGRYWVFGRLRPGISIDAARAALNGGRSGATERGVVRYTGMIPDLMDGLRRITSILEFASTAVFLMACANVGSFLLGRASARSRETSVRVALGASRGRLARQLLSDSVLLSLVGSALGLLLALWTADLIPALFFVEDAERLVFAPDTSRTLVTAIVSAGLAIVCGLLPMLETRADRPAAVLQRENAGPSSRTQRIRTGLVVVQMTCCCVLVTSTGFLFHGFRASVQTGLGREVGDAVLASVQTTADRGPAYFEGIEAAAQSVNAVSEWAWTGRLPGGRAVWQPLRLEPPIVPVREATINVAAFTPDSLDSVMLPPKTGRMFGGRDTPTSCRVAIVNEEGANELFNGDAVGRWLEEMAGQRFEIIGVVSAKAADGDPATSTPTVFWYANQIGAPYDWAGPKRVRVAATQKLATAILDAHVVSANYFARMGYTTLAGEVFSQNPRGAACREAVVNQKAADRYFAGGAVGAAVIDQTGRRTQIVGVVQEPSLQLFTRAAEPSIYYPMADDFVPRMTLILRAANVDDEWLTNLRQRLEAVPGAVAPPAVRTLATHLRQTALAPLRIVTVLVSALSLMALVLAVLGVYSALSDSARRRRRDIALRMAFGAQGWRIVRQVTDEGVRLAAAGIFLGMLLSAAAVRWLSPMIPGASVTELWVWFTAPVTIISAVVAASVIPAIRALAVDPLVITRDER
jgi:predicted permease